MALRNAGQKLKRHLLPGSVLYSSSEPCPMCLTACYWARVSRLVFGATSYDVATYGFEDLCSIPRRATQRLSMRPFASFRLVPVSSR
jgi:tRNA(Arg) A34 adenosine deaminase TadA